MPEPSAAAPRAGSILVVCTGNICRSPYLERRLAQLLAGRGYDISSAGTRAMVGQPIEPGSASRLERAGADVSGFAARSLTSELVRSADLVLTMTRAHRQEVVRLDPTALRRTHVLGDLADALAVAGHDEALDGESRVAHLVRVAGAARSRVRVRSREQVDVTDPYGRSDGAYAQMAAEIERELGPLIAALTG